MEIQQLIQDKWKVSYLEFSIYNRNIMFCQFLSNDRIIILHFKGQNEYFGTLLSNEANQEINTIPLITDSKVISIKNFGDSQNKQRDILALETLKKQYSTHLIQKIRQIIILTIVGDNMVLQKMGKCISLVGTVIPFDNQLLAFNKQGRLIQINTNSSLNAEELFAKAQVHPLSKKFQPFLNGIWLKFKQILIIYEEGSIHTIYFNQDLSVKKIQKKQCFGLTCCGASLNSVSIYYLQIFIFMLFKLQTNSLAAIGDLSGNVKLFQVEKIENSKSNEESKEIQIYNHIEIKQIKYQNTNYMGIRCVQFHPQHPNLLAYGTLSTGEIFVIQVAQDGKILGPKLLASLNQTVTVLKWSPQNLSNSQNIYLACGLITGEIVFLQLNRENFEVQNFSRTVAHLTAEKSQSFGSLDIQAQIWSLCFNPKIQNLNGLEIASCSQDQTLKLWSIDLSNKNNAKFSSIVEVKDHTKAVTCVNWFHEKDLEILISCSDDQNVYVYKRSQFSKLKIIRKFSSQGLITQWHTLTYMKYQQGLVAVGTQNGYLLIYNLALDGEKTEGALLYGRKIHGGGIQGLDWNSNYLILCSNDCGCSFIHFNSKQ